MSVETIVGAIAAEADAEVERIAEEAARRVESIFAGARARSHEEQTRWEGSRAEETSQAVAGIVNRARLDSDRKVADAREAMFQVALGHLVDRIEEVVAGSEYPGIFRALHAEAMSVVADPGATMLVRPSDVGLAGRVARDHAVTGEVKGVLDCIGGLDVESDDGRSVRNTIDSRLLQSGRRLRRLAVQVIPEMASQEAQI